MATKDKFTADWHIEIRAQRALIDAALAKLPRPGAPVSPKKGIQS